MAMGATLDRAKWRFRNRDRSESATRDPRLAPLVDALRRDGIVLTTAGTLFPDMSLYAEAAARAIEMTPDSSG